MITAILPKDNTGFEISGHGAGSEGNDIVCAAVSSAAYMAVNTLTDVAKIKLNAIVSYGHMKVVLEEKSEVSDIILQGLRLHLKQLKAQYPSQVIILSTLNVKYGGATNA